MSAAWDTAKPYEPIPAMKRMWRMWTYVCVGALFFLYLRIHLGF
jgi:hypothetical protein